MNEHEPFSMAFKELIRNITEKSRRDYLFLNNIAPGESVTLKDGQDELLTSFRFYNNDYVWQKIVSELRLNCMKDGANAIEAKNVEENLIKSGSLSKLCLAAILIAGIEDHAALFHKIWY